jgi:hypothetical protein
VGGNSDVSNLSLVVYLYPSSLPFCLIATGNQEAQTTILIAYSLFVHEIARKTTATSSIGIFFPTYEISHTKLDMRIQFQRNRSDRGSIDRSLDWLADP